MKRHNIYSFILIIGLFFSSSAWGNYVALQPEPALKTQVGWDVQPNGLLFISYDLDQNGKVDFIALRRVLKTYFTDEPLRMVAKSNGGCPVFFVNYHSSRFVYITSKMPLFYAIDRNEDGLWDLMYKDVLEDGVNGNERFYDSPSGMFVNGDKG